MKAVVLAVAVLYGAVPSADSGIEAFHYQRVLTLAPGASGRACTVPDAAVFAHAASQTLGDLGIYQQDAAGHIAAAPFSLAISDTQTTESDPATVMNLHGEDGAIDFDLKMPARPHSSVDLDLAAKDFMGTAVVSGMMSAAGTRTSLGTFPIFDLASQNLSRATVLPMQETSYPWLHVQLRLKSRAGGLALKPEIVRGATVPPSRQAQRVYSDVATTEAFQQVGQDTVTILHLPEHVPAERIRFVLAPGSHENFERRVEVVATPDGASTGRSERVDASISRTELAPTAGEPMPINDQTMAVDTAFAANFKTGATVRVVIHNGWQSPLSLNAVKIEMRQRTICFEAQASNRYSLLYGMQGQDDENEPRINSSSAATNVLPAQLGPEIPNALYAGEQKPRELLERQPDLLWAISAATLAILGSTALRRRRVRKS